MTIMPSISPFFSVIMPVYNVEKYLGEAINSVLAQTFTNFELILVDDGSTDASSTIAHRYQHDDPRVRLIRQENAGLSAARNTGLEHAKGHYLYFMDSDDMINPNTLECLQKQQAAHQPDLLAFNAEPFLDDNMNYLEGKEIILQGYQDAYRREYLQEKLYSGPEFYKTMAQRLNFVANAYLFAIKASFLKEINLKFVNGLIYEDEVFARYLLMDTKTIYYINQNLYQRRIRNNSIMRSDFSQKKLISLIIAAEKIFSLYKRKKIHHLKEDATWLFTLAVTRYEEAYPDDFLVLKRIIGSPLFLLQKRKSELAKRFLRFKFPTLHKFYQRIRKVISAQR